MTQPKRSSSVTGASDLAKQSLSQAGLSARKRVVLTRPAERQQHLAQKLEQAGFEVLQLPALVISPVLPDEANGVAEINDTKKVANANGANEADATHATNVTNAKNGANATNDIMAAVVAGSAGTYVSTDVRSNANNNNDNKKNDDNANDNVDVNDDFNALSTPEKSASDAGVANGQRGGSCGGLRGEQLGGQRGGVPGGPPGVGPQAAGGEQRQGQLAQQLTQQPQQQAQQQPQQQTKQQPQHQSGHFDVLVFVSRAAWQCYRQFYMRFYQQFYPHFYPQGSGLDGAAQHSHQNSPQSPILACVGLSTAKEIAGDLQLPLERIVYPTGDLASDSEGLWAVLRPKLEELATRAAVRKGVGEGAGKGLNVGASDVETEEARGNVRGDVSEKISAGAKEGIRALIVRGQTGRDWLADTFKEYGMAVTCLSVYRREPVEWTTDQIETLDRWAGERQPEQAQAQVQGEEMVQELNPSSTGTWLITSAESLAAIAAEYEAHRLTGKAGFQPQAVVVVHERLVPLVQAWLGHWSDSTGLGSSRGHAASEPVGVPVVVTTPDDEAILVAILSL